MRDPVSRLEAIRDMFMNQRGDVDPGFMEDFSMRVSGWTERMDGNEEVDDLALVASSILDEAEGIYPGRRVWGAARTFVAVQLLEKDEVDVSAAILARIPDPNLAMQAVIAIGQLITAEHPEKAYLHEQMYMNMLEEMDRSGDHDKAHQVRRHMRNFLIAERPEVLTNPLFDTIDQGLGHGNETYDRIADWAQLDAIDLPNARWNDIVALVRDDSLWTEEVTIGLRQHFGHMIAMVQQGYSEAAEIHEDSIVTLEQMLTLWSQIISDPAEIRRFRQTFAATFRQYGHDAHADRLEGLET